MPTNNQSDGPGCYAFVLLVAVICATAVAITWMFVTH